MNLEPDLYASTPVHAVGMQLTAATLDEKWPTDARSSATRAAHAVARHRASIVLSSIVIVVCLGTVLAHATRSVGAPGADLTPPACVVVEHDGLRYEFDALSGRRRICDPRDPDTDLLPARPGGMERFRELIESKAGRTLEEMQDAHRDSTAALRRLGYL